MLHYAGQQAQHASNWAILVLAPVTFWRQYCLAGLMVKVSTLRVADSGFDSCLRQDFSGSSYTSDLKIGTQVATLPSAWRYRVSAGTGQHGDSLLWLGEVES